MHNRPRADLMRLMPDLLRIRDAANGRPLEALLGVLSEELQTVEQDIDQLYDNWFIESCEPWVIPYIGALIGARPMRSFGAGEVGLRSYVARTLGYRQAKGTAAALEQIARDVTGWPVIAVEFFERLIWSQHVNHVRPGALGTVSIRDAEGARQAHGPFETACHSAAAGRADGFAGRYNIPHVGLFVWRLDAYPLGFLTEAADGYLGGIVPRASTLGPGFLHFDPLGADRALVNRPKPDRSIAGRVDMRMVPVPLDRRLLARDLDGLRNGAQARWFDDVPVAQFRLDGAAVPADKLHSCNLETRPDGGGNPTWRRPASPGHVLFDPELGRVALHADDEGKPLEVTCAHAAPFAIGGGPYDRRASLAAWQDRYIVPGQPLPWMIGVTRRVQHQTGNPLQGGVVVASLAAAVEAWNAVAAAGMRGIIVMLDNATYDEDLTTPARVITIPPAARLAILAAEWPLTRTAGGSTPRDSTALTALYRRAHIQSDLQVKGEAPAADQAPGEFLCDGLLIEGEIAVAGGALGQLELRHCTLGASASGLGSGVRVVASNAALAVNIDHCVTGTIDLANAGGGLMLADSVIGEDRDVEADPDSLPLVLGAAKADAVIARCTVLGRSKVRTIEGENSIFYAKLHADYRQHGCLRFSYAPLSSRVPRRYRCQPDMALEAAGAASGQPLASDAAARIARGMMPIFTSSSFPSPAFGQLALACPDAITAGAFGGAEMGAGFANGEPFRRANLADMLDEFLPFGLTAAALYQN